ncbi:MAG: sigma-70 family RNA polymerase sigma factor [Acidobacteriia bacterium]|nr:sigma-70 family RNA polymerase sigma factor [Terriglobia bacterium]
MFKDRTIPELAATKVSSAQGTSPKPTPLEEEVVALFDQMQDRLLRYLLSTGVSVQDGEEIVQEVFLALFQHLQRGKSRRNLRAWVFQVAHNLSVKRYLANRRDRQNLVEPGEAPAEHTFIDRAPNPEDQLASNQSQARLQSVFRALPQQDRRCLSLRAEGLTYREIGKVLDMSLGAVALSLGRSLARFARVEER